MIQQLLRISTTLRDRPALVLSGAGISTDSGIPDYRSPEALARPREPMRFQEFARSEAARRRYWARSHGGWQRMAVLRPNAAHFAVAELEAAGLVTGVLTQNVDGLHQKAGSRNVLELHGSLSRVRCLDCRNAEPMVSHQKRLAALNPEFRAEPARLNPDGDTELPDAVAAGFTPAPCLVCGGPMKTDVVFFGENVPGPVAQTAWSMLDASGSMLVLGSSLTVRSGYRFPLAAAEKGMPVMIINRGETRGDGLATVRVDAPLGEALPELVRISSGS